jgi:hypothetical protein
MKSTNASATMHTSTTMAVMRSDRGTDTRRRIRDRI